MGHADTRNSIEQGPRSADRPARRARCASATWPRARGLESEVIRHEDVPPSIDVVMNVNGRDIDAVACDVRSRIEEIAFPLEYRAELGSDTPKSNPIACTYRVPWRRRWASSCCCRRRSGAGPRDRFLTMPLALAGGVVAIAIDGADRFAALVRASCHPGDRRPAPCCSSFAVTHLEDVGGFDAAPPRLEQPPRPSRADGDGVRGSPSRPLPLGDRAPATRSWTRWLPSSSVGSSPRRSLHPVRRSGAVCPPRSGRDAGSELKTMFLPPIALVAGLKCGRRKSDTGGKKRYAPRSMCDVGPDPRLRSAALGVGLFLHRRQAVAEKYHPAKIEDTRRQGEIKRTSLSWMTRAAENRPRDPGRPEGRAGHARRHGGDAQGHPLRGGHVRPQVRRGRTPARSRSSSSGADRGGGSRAIGVPAPGPPGDGRGDRRCSELWAPNTRSAKMRPRRRSPPCCAGSSERA